MGVGKTRLPTPLGGVADPGGKNFEAMDLGHQEELGGDKHSSVIGLNSSIILECLTGTNPHFQSRQKPTSTLRPQASTLMPKAPTLKPKAKRLIEPFTKLYV